MFGDCSKQIVYVIKAEFKKIFYSMNSGKGSISS